MALLDDEIKKFVGEQAELGCWNQDFEYRLRRALIRYHTIQSKELKERVKELEDALVYAIRALKAVNSFGATKAIIEDLEKTLKK